MSKQNYSNYSKKDVNVEPEVMETKVVEPEVVETETVQVEPEVVETKTETKTKVKNKAKEIFTTGVVVDCKKLRVRKNPNANAEVLCELNVGDKVTLDIANSTTTFYKVTTKVGVKGYCMIKYVKAD